MDMVIQLLILYYISPPGSILTSCGFLGSSLAWSLECLYITYGLIVGFGINLIILADGTIIPQYFRKRLSLATGVAMTGVAIGTFLFAAVNEYLINKYGLGGAFLILAGISLNGVPLGMLMKMPERDNGETRFLLQKSGTEQIPINKTEPDKVITESVEQKYEQMSGHENGQSSDRTASNKDSIFTTIGLDLFLDQQFLLANISAILIIMPHNVIPTIFPDHLLSLGYTSHQATNTVVYIGIANMLSRLVVWDAAGEDPRLWLFVLSVSSIFSGLSLLLTCLFTHYWMFVLLCIVFGILRGLYIIYMYLLLNTIVMKERIHHGVGIMYTSWGVGILIGLTVSGLIADVSPGPAHYVFVLVFVGAAEIVGGLILCLMRILWNGTVQDTIAVRTGE